MRKDISFEKYDILCDRFQHSSFRCGNWWPSIKEIQENIEPKAEQYLEFLIWIVETANDPTTPEQKESRSYINNLLNRTLVFTD